MIEHKHLIVRATVVEPPREDEIDYVRDWFEALVDKLNMKLLSGPYVEYVNIRGNAGITAVCIIETSHIAMHVWDEQDPALMQLDVYSCGPLDPRVVFNALKDFEPRKIEFKFLDREHGLEVVRSSELIEIADALD